MKRIIALCVVAFCLCITWAGQRPNILFIMSDDCTHWDLGCYGSKDSKTPNIDKLASQGMQFNRCYQAAPMCSPTRHNVYTGQYPVKTGAYPNHTNANVGTQSIVQYLKPLGYRVALSGKRHIGPKVVFPFEYLGNTKNPEMTLVEGFLKEVKQSNEPFALMYCSNEPHTPWNKGDASQFNPQSITLPPHYVDTKETREAYCDYLAEINFMDKQVGDVLELLDKYNLTENTMVVYVSEQGNSFPFAKWTLYEAGVKSAMIIKWPGKVKAGSQSNAIVEYSDLVPTFIEMAGGEIPQQMDGKSLLPIFMGHKKKVKDYAFSIQTTRGIYSGAEYYGIRAVVDENYRYILNLTPGVEFKNTVINGKKINAWMQSWRERAKTDPDAADILKRYRIRPEEELYDIKNDRWCINNLANNPDFANKKAELRAQLQKWMKACGDKGQKTEMEAFKHMPGKRKEH